MSAVCCSKLSLLSKVSLRCLWLSTVSTASPLMLTGLWVGLGADQLQELKTSSEHPDPAKRRDRQLLVDLEQQGWSARCLPVEVGCRRILRQQQFRHRGRDWGEQTAAERASTWLSMAEKRRAMDSKGQSSSRYTADDVSRQASEDVFIQSWVN